MRWEGRRTSGNVEDRRGMSRGMVIGGGGGLATLVIVAIAMLTGVDPRQILQSAPSADAGQQQGGAPPADDPQAQFVSVILADTEDTWNQVLPQHGRQYEEPKLVLFSDAVASACGNASAAVGPFYCSRDATVYLDMSFFNDLEQRFGAPGDFARAYVIAHEVGHHVQNLLGILPKVQQAQRASGDRVQSNHLQVQVELQADCFAGVWANHAEAQKQFLDPGDIDAALQTASAIGDDTLQRKSQGQVVPDSFTHGSAEQRKRWFSTGFKEGTIKACNTFAAANRL